MDQINLLSIRTTTEEGFCMSIKGKSKTAKKRIYWLFTEYHFDESKELDWYLTRELLSLFVRKFEQSNPSSSTFSESTTRRWRSGWILENWGKSSESVCTSSWLVWQSMESMLGSRRRSEKEPSVLHWFRNNLFSPSSSRAFRTQSFWSSIARQCCDSERILPTSVAHLMCS